jgi:hypothetical protein
MTAKERKMLDDIARLAKEKDEHIPPGRDHKVLPLILSFCDDAAAEIRELYDVNVEDIPYEVRRLRKWVEALYDLRRDLEEFIDGLEEERKEKAT